MRRISRTLACLALVLPLLCLADATVPVKDISGAKDPAWLKRYEGSFIVSHAQRRFDAVEFPASKLLVDPSKDERDAMNNQLAVPKRKIRAEGEFTRLVYVAPEDRSTLEVISNYIDEFEASGAKFVFGCKNEACGEKMVGNDHGGSVQGLIEQLYPQKQVKDPAFSNGNCATTRGIAEQRYILAQIPGGGSGGDKTVGVIAFTMQDEQYCKALNDRTVVLVVAVEAKARENKMVIVKSGEMAKVLAAEGRISLYGIYFDTNKSAVKPESKPTLEQIGALLKSQPKLALNVVGHTDNVGGDKYNLGLSQRRADAVVAALVEDYGIDPERLQASGAGLTKPVAANDDEAGRAKNRRVELVKR